ncbi:SGNH/GDSL hydrolase family protein [Curvibacter sp. RS43]|uniref:SGNH/GDSL hydrolase family protein n=1 Tax=Curvibacter microcysteis TaxID=3026419 RepID=UPI00235E52EE|nr:SGNH/GDSL hydrolase family protein [Curvibacter sp. RS43]MDD0810873.1 SGNH/GDSL hydrolase family protein [Curvibacter sp. RS43]
MTGKWLRRAVLLAACASAAVLTACGSSTIESALAPSRFIAFGDGLSDLGQSGSRYTVNDGTVNVWTQQVATSYGLNLSTVSAGGKSYARGHARLISTTDDVGGSTLSVKQQVDAFLAADKFGGNDVVFINGGLGDLLAQYAASTDATALSNVMSQAGTDLGTQVRRLVTAGAKYVVVSGLYDVSKSPWGVASGQASNISSAVLKFNSALLLSINDLGANVLYIDAAYYYNLVIASPSGYSLTDATNIACTSVDSGKGIGIGTSQVNASLCTTSTLASGVDYTKYTFADKVYFTPAAQTLYGTYAYGRMKSRW